MSSISRSPSLSAALLSLALVGASSSTALAGLPAGVQIPASSIAGPVPATPGTGAQGTIFSSFASSISGADQIIATSTPAGTWNAANIDYANSPIETPLSTWFASDASSLQSIPGTTPVSGLTMVVGGLIAIPAAGSYIFTVSSDDGMRLRIGGLVVATYDGDRGVSPTSGTATFTEPGLYPIDLLYWANASGASALQFAWQRPGDTAASVVPGTSLYLVPTPSAISMLAAAGIVAGRRRR